MLIKAYRFYGIGLTLVAVGAIAACSSDNSSTGGTAGATNQAGAVGVAGSSTGTGGTTGTAGTGAGKGGTGTGTAGTGTGTAGSGGGASTYACKGTAPMGALITGFEDAAADTMTVGQFKVAAPIAGGTFSYPAAIKVDAAGKNLHITGMVDNYAGFGVYFNECYNPTGAGATGVSFNVKGNVGASMKLSVRIQTNANTAVNPAYMKGTCPIPAGTSPTGDVYAYCHTAATDVTIPAGGGDVSVTWDKFAGGMPTATVDGKDVMGVEWALSWMTGDTAYPVDLTIDDIKFTGTLSGGGGGGSGGAGGSGGGSAGGAGGSGGTGGSGGAGGSGGTGGSGGKGGTGGSGGTGGNQ